MAFYLTAYPGLLKTFLSYLNCRVIGDLDVSYADTNINCSGDFYTRYVLPVGVCIIFFLGICIPIWICIALFRNRNRKYLNTVQCMKKYGILYLTYTE